MSHFKVANFTVCEFHLNKNIMLKKVKEKKKNEVDFHLLVQKDL